MRVVVAGGSGLLGQALASRLVASRHEVVVLTRDPRGTIATRPQSKSLRYVVWQPDGTAQGAWVHELDGVDGVVNLAGAGLADHRWTAARKTLLRESRFLSTRSLVRAIEATPKRPQTFVQASGVGYYGADMSDRIVDETSPRGDDFLARLAADWEAEARAVEALGCRLVITRQGVVLSRKGGALKKLCLPFLFFVGGPVGSGRQYVSWIHGDDWIEIVLWSMLTPTVVGTLNATAPDPVTDAAFCKALGRASHRPSWLPVPPFALRLALGEMADPMLIKGQRALPRQLEAFGFTFRYPTIDEAMTDLFSTPLAAGLHSS